MTRGSIGKISALLAAAVLLGGGASGEIKPDPYFESFIVQNVKRWGTLEFDAQIAENASRQGINNGKALSGAHGGFKDVLALGKAGIDLAAKGRDFEQAYKPLSPDDDDIAKSAKRGMPSTPSGCGGTDPNKRAASAEPCGKCFTDAYVHLTRLRFNFEKLRATGKATENYTKRAIAFGDSAAGVHGIAGLAWQSERTKIEQSLVNFNKIYDDKYDELIGTSEEVLHKIAECEAQYMSDPDWYDRYGFMYYAALENRYQR